MGGLLAVGAFVSLDGPDELGTPFHPANQVRQGHFQPDGDFRQSQPPHMQKAALQALERIHVHIAAVRRLFLGQPTFQATLSNLLAQDPFE